MYGNNTEVKVNNVNVRICCSWTKPTRGMSCLFSSLTIDVGLRNDTLNALIASGFCICAFCIAYETRIRYRSQTIAICHSPALFLLSSRRWRSYSNSTAIFLLKKYKMMGFEESIEVWWLTCFVLFQHSWHTGRQAGSKGWNGRRIFSACMHVCRESIAEEKLTNSNIITAIISRLSHR